MNRATAAKSAPVNSIPLIRRQRNRKTKMRQILTSFKPPAPKTRLLSAEKRHGKSKPKSRRARVFISRRWLKHQHQRYTPWPPLMLETLTSFTTAVNSANRSRVPSSFLQPRMIRQPFSASAIATRRPMPRLQPGTRAHRFATSVTVKIFPVRLSNNLAPSRTPLIYSKAFSRLMLS